MHPPAEKGTENDVIIKRIVAQVIDLILIITISLLLTFAGIFATGILESVGAGGIQLIAFIFSHIIVMVFLFTYTFLLEGYWGQTIGKKVLGIVVIKEDGSKCDYKASITRNLLRIIDILPESYIIGLISIAASDKRQRIGDRLADTIVVETKY